MGSGLSNLSPELRNPTARSPDSLQAWPVARSFPLGSSGLSRAQMIWKKFSVLLGPPHPPTTASIGEDFGLWCTTYQKCPFPWWLCKCFHPSKWQFYSLDSKLAQDSLRKSLSFKKKCLFSRAAKIPGIFWDYRVRTTLRTKNQQKISPFRGKVSSEQPNLHYSLSGLPDITG